MPGWICPVCKLENSLFDSQCKACRQPKADMRDSTASHSVLSASIDSLRSRNQNMLDEFRSNLSRGSGEILSSYGSPSPASSRQTMPTPPDAPGVENAELFEDEEELPDLVSYAEFGQRLQMTDTGSGLNLLMQHAGAPPFQRIANRDLKLKVKALPRLNYSLVHAGQPPTCFLMKGHAYYGVWISLQNYIRNALLHLSSVWKKHAQVMKLVEANDLMPLNSTTFAVPSDKPFLACREEGMHFILDSKVFQCGVDVVLAHRGAAKPLP